MVTTIREPTAAETREAADLALLAEEREWLDSHPIEDKDAEPYDPADWYDSPESLGHRTH